MKILIAYSSLTGNTQKLAETVHAQLGGDKTLCAIDDAPPPVGYDLVALGFHLVAGKPDPKSAQYLAQCGSAQLFLFATHGAAADSAHALNGINHALSLAPLARIVGTFNCPGQVEPQFLEKARAKATPPPWIADAGAAQGHPDEADLRRLGEVLKTQLHEYMA